MASTKAFRFSFAGLIGFTGLLGIALTAGGCPTTPPDSLGPLGSLVPDADPARPATAFVGKLANTRAAIGLVSDGADVLAYVCDGDEGQDSFSQWFAGRITDGAFSLRGIDDSPDPGPYGTVYAASSLNGSIRDGFAEGWLVLDNGRWLEWTAEPVNPQTAAGLYARATEELLAGVVITNDNRSIGLVGFRTEAIRREVEVNQRTVNAMRLQVQALDPRDILLRFEVQRVTTPGREQVTRRPRPEAEPMREIEVKFRDSFTVRLRLDHESGQLRPHGLVPLGGDERDAALTSGLARGILHDLSRGRWERLCLEAPEERLDDLRAQALAELAERPAGRQQETVPDMNNWFWYRVPAELDPTTVVMQLRRLPEVEYAGPMPREVVPATLPPDMTVDPNASGAYQAYIDPASAGGIDARYAWTVPGGTGQGVSVCTVEYDVDRFHLDLIVGAPDPIQRWGDTPQYSKGKYRDHGTAVLGIIGARRNSFGITGIAHMASLSYAPVATQTTQGHVNLANAIMLATTNVQKGDIIVIEQQVAGPNRLTESDTDQTGLVAAEWNRAAFDAIRLATYAGRVVVECAGNGRSSFALYAFNDPEVNGGHHPFAVDAAGQPLKDSGAIMVGAGFSPLFEDTGGGRGYERQHNTSSNYGRRIDVQSWGDNILSLGHPKSDPPLLYPGPPITLYSEFGGTSGAGAIVAGLCASLQGIARIDFGRSLRPEEMRDLLKAASLPQVARFDQLPGSPADFWPIGRMPVLRAAADVLRGPLPRPLFDPIPDPADPAITPATPKLVTINLDPSLNPAYFRIAYTTDGSAPYGFPLDQPLAPGGSIRLINPGQTITLTQPGLLRAVAFMPTRALGGVFDDRGRVSVDISAYYGLHIPPPTPNITSGAYPGILYVTLNHNLGEDYHFYERLYFTQNNTQTETFRAGSFFVLYTLDGSEPDLSIFENFRPGTPSQLMSLPTDTQSWNEAWPALATGSTRLLGYHYWRMTDNAPLESRVPFNPTIAIFADSPNVTLKARVGVGLGFPVLAPNHYAWSDLRVETYVQTTP